MPFAGPINAPAALDILAAVRIRFMEAYSDAYGSAAYKDYQSFTYMDDPAGDVIYNIYAEPMLPLRQWLGDRPSSSIDFNYWTQAVRTFGDGLELDVDDMRDDANPAKRLFYMQMAEKFAEAALGLWPSLVVEAVINSINRVWLPDGQKIFDTHPFNPRRASLGSFRNYRANNVQGGSAAYPLTYANVLAQLKAGLGFKAPTGLDYPVRYSILAVPPSSAKEAARLTTFDRLPTAELFGQTLGSTNVGGDSPNEIARLYSPQVKELANMPTGTWALIDANSRSELPVGLKKRQDITWQYVGPSSATSGMIPISDEGAVSEMVFNRNRTKYGPKARGDAFIRNWWRIFLADGNATPRTTLEVVS